MTSSGGAVQSTASRRMAAKHCACGHPSRRRLRRLLWMRSRKSFTRPLDEVERDFARAPQRSEIRPVCLRDREQVLAEMIAVVFGADRLQQLVLHLAPPLPHVQRLAEGAA